MGALLHKCGLTYIYMLRGSHENDGFRRRTFIQCITYDLPSRILKYIFSHYIDYPWNTWLVHISQHPANQAVDLSINMHTGPHENDGFRRRSFIQCITIWLTQQNTEVNLFPPHWSYLEYLIGPHKSTSSTPSWKIKR